MGSTRRNTAEGKIERIESSKSPVKSKPDGSPGPKESKEYAREERFEDIATRRELLNKSRQLFH
jgi:hypothetical protein